MPTHFLERRVNLKSWGAIVFSLITAGRIVCGGEGADMEIVVYPGILVPRKYLSWQKIFGKVTTLNRKVDYNVR